MEIEQGSPMPFADHRREEFEQGIARLNFEELWQICGQEGAAPKEFEEGLREALAPYRPGPDRLASLPAKERKPAYDKLQKAIGNLHKQLENLHEHVAWEIDTAGIDFEPEEFELSLPKECEGLGYGAYQIHTLIDRLEEFSLIVTEAQKLHSRPKGKPKQNANLEGTLKALGAVFEKYSGRGPMAGYRFDEADEVQPYVGPFFDFLHAVIWKLNGQEKPSSHSLGDAARRAFGLRK